MPHTLHTPATARDLDETRRMIWMVLLAPRTERYEVAATALNALAYHQASATRNLSPDQIADRIVAYLEGEDDGSAEKWLKKQVKRVTRELGS